MELIHYGAKEFIPDKFYTIRNNFVKPTGGLWTSPINSEWGWKDWCKAEEFRECIEDNSFKLKLKDSARILVIDSKEDLDKLHWLIIHDFMYTPDFEECCKHYDAIHLTARGQWATRMTHPKSLYGWDCESVLILNKEIII